MISVICLLALAATANAASFSNCGKLSSSLSFHSVHFSYFGKLYLKLHPLWYLVAMYDMLKESMDNYHCISLQLNYGSFQFTVHLYSLFLF